METPFGVLKNIFYVKDNGIGIDPRFYQAVFRIFKRLPEAAGHCAEGSGVGLAFAKEIVERAHGRIWLESKPGEGSIFYFTLKNSE